MPKGLQPSCRRSSSRHCTVCGPRPCHRRTSAVAGVSKNQTLDPQHKECGMTPPTYRDTFARIALNLDRTAQQLIIPAKRGLTSACGEIAHMHSEALSLKLEEAELRAVCLEERAVHSFRLPASKRMATSLRLARARGSDTMPGDADAARPNMASCPSLRGALSPESKRQGSTWPQLRAELLADASRCRHGSHSDDIRTRKASPRTRASSSGPKVRLSYIHIQRT